MCGSNDVQLLLINELSGDVQRRSMELVQSIGLQERPQFPWWLVGMADTQRPRDTPNGLGKAAVLALHLS